MIAVWLQLPHLVLLAGPHTMHTLLLSVAADGLIRLSSPHLFATPPCQLCHMQYNQPTRAAFHCALFLSLLSKLSLSLINFFQNSCKILAL